MKQLETILKNCDLINGYRISSTERTSYEVFFVHKKLETVRSTETVSTDVTVYVDHDGKKGDSTFSVFGSMTDADLQAKVASAAARAKLVFNEPYELPAGGTLETELPSNFKQYEFPDLAARIADAVYAADSYRDGSINAVEIFLYRDVIRVKNSRGIVKTQVCYSAEIEAIPTWNEGESVELYEVYNFTEFDAAKITAEINRRMCEVRDRQHAVKPAPMTCNVVLHTHEIVSLMGDLVGDLNFRTVYAHSNLHKKEDDLQKDGKGDKLTVNVRASVPGSCSSRVFDTDGVDLTDRTVVENGKVVNYFGGHRFACYLGEVPTGDLRCVELATGTLTDENLAKTPYLECMSLSGLQVDLYNDYIGGEIRLAYWFDGKEKKPVTGISMSARLTEVLAGLRLSDKLTVDGEYRGPETMMLPDVSVL